MLAERGHELILAGRSSERLEALGRRLASGQHSRTQILVRERNGDVGGVRAAEGVVPRLLTLDLTEPRRLEA
ncbi:short chain dehydrogenase, partial [Actinomadura adrarensis]